MEPAKTCLKFLGLTLITLLITLSVQSQEARPEFKNINPLASLPAPGTKIKVEIQPGLLPANSEVFLATILDSQLTIIKAEQSVDNKSYLSFTFPAPLIHLKYFALASNQGKIIAQGEVKELSRNCMPATESKPAKNTSAADQMLIDAKLLEQEINNLEQAHRNLLKLKDLLLRQDDQA